MKKKCACGDRKEPICKSWMTFNHEYKMDLPAPRKPQRRRNLIGEKL
jgi:hypothetical protein